MPSPYVIALALLTRRDYSQHELVQKLKSKNCEPEQITTTITELVQSGYLNDARYAEAFIHARRNKGYGPARISQELRAKGIHNEIIAEAMKITDNAWFTAAQQLWQKRFKGKLPTNFKDRAKQTRFLQYRGFMREHIERIFKPVEECE